MAEENAVPQLTLGQRVAACAVVAADINKGNSGLTAEDWTTKAKGAFGPGVGISVYQDGVKFAQITVNSKGYLTISTYLEKVEPATLAKLEAFGFVPGKFTTTVKSYPGMDKQFDTSRLAK